MEINEEKLLSRFPTLISYRSTEKILEQMKKNICKINIGKKGTGFFCEIPFPDKENLLKVLITNNHVINKELFNKKIELLIYEKTEKIYLDLGLSKRMKYTNEDFDITIIQILEDIDNINNFLELDEQVISNIISDENNNKDYEDKTIYIIQYPGEGLSVSYGILTNIYEDKINKFNHTCCTNKGSSGSPIIGINNKIIGIHIGEINGKNYNFGSFLNLAIREFNELKHKMLLIKFNEKFNISIEDPNVEQISIIKPKKQLENNGLSELSKISFQNLKLLDLSQNKIININCLENAKFENLEKLILNRNSIYNISSLTKVKFNELKDLELGGNKIKDITPLKDTNFYNLEKLKLDNNGIENIDFLKEVKFKELKELNLFKNNIGDIEALGSKSIKFDKLEILTLGKNNIKNINDLENAKFKENLIELNLRNNGIKEIKALAKFKGLKILKLSGTKISDIRILGDLKNHLEELYLGENSNLKNIEIFKDDTFDKLKELNLEKIGKNIDSNTFYEIKSRQPEGLNLKPDMK